MDQQTAMMISHSVVKPLNDFAQWIAENAKTSKTGDELAFWIFLASQWAKTMEEIKANLKDIKP